MRRSHWLGFQPVCPRCLLTGHTVSLELAGKTQFDSNDNIDGGLVICPSGDCGQEYPIIDGVPILVPNVREYVQNYISQIAQRHNLPLDLESLIGDCLGPDSAQNLTKYYLSSYCHDGYAEYAENGITGSSGVARLTSQCLSLLDVERPALSLDLGCSVGRSTFEMARTLARPVLGIDLNFSMVQFAQGILHESLHAYPLRATGIVHDQIPIRPTLSNREHVDFWVCDAQQLPFTSSSMDLIQGLNLLDSVTAPVQLVDEIGRVLQDGAVAGLATPFDWSSTVTPMEHWIGGHSQRSHWAGDAVKVLHAMFPRQLDGDASLILENELDGVQWSTRRNRRSSVTYEEYMFSLRKISE